MSKSLRPGEQMDDVGDSGDVPLQSRESTPNSGSFMDSLRRNSNRIALAASMGLAGVTGLVGGTAGCADEGIDTDGSGGQGGENVGTVSQKLTDPTWGQTGLNISPFVYWSDATHGIAVFVSDKAGGPNPDDIYFSLTSDGGGTWTPESLIDDSASVVKVNSTSEELSASICAGSPACGSGKLIWSSDRDGGDDLYWGDFDITSGKATNGIKLPVGGTKVNTNVGAERSVTVDPTNSKMYYLGSTGIPYVADIGVWDRTALTGSTTTTHQGITMFNESGTNYLSMGVKTGCANVAGSRDVCRETLVGTVLSTPTNWNAKGGIWATTNTAVVEDYPMVDSKKILWRAQAGKIKAIDPTPPPVDGGVDAGADADAAADAAPDAKPDDDAGSDADAGDAGSDAGDASDDGGSDAGDGGDAGADSGADAGGQGGAGGHGGSGGGAPEGGSGGGNPQDGGKGGSPDVDAGDAGSDAAVDAAADAKADTGASDSGPDAATGCSITAVKKSGTTCEVSNCGVVGEKMKIRLEDSDCDVSFSFKGFDNSTVVSFHTSLPGLKELQYDGHYITMADGVDKTLDHTPGSPEVQFAWALKAGGSDISMGQLGTKDSCKWVTSTNSEYHVSRGLVCNVTEGAVPFWIGVGKDQVAYQAFDFGKGPGIAPVGANVVIDLDTAALIASNMKVPDGGPTVSPNPPGEGGGCGICSVPDGMGKTRNDLGAWAIAAGIALLAYRRKNGFVGIESTDNKEEK